MAKIDAIIKGDDSTRSFLSFVLLLIQHNIISTNRFLALGDLDRTHKEDVFTMDVHPDIIYLFTVQCLLLAT
jgi:hypothetical protein